MPPERRATTYGPGITAASKAVLLEVMTVLRADREFLILVGGWVPYFLLEPSVRPGPPVSHVGSIDIDLAVDPSRVGESEYLTIVERLTERGYRPASTRRGTPMPSSFERTIQSPVTRKPYTIRVDFLTHQADPRPGRHHTLPVQDDLLARKIKGCEAAFAHQTAFDLTGALPDGGTLTVPIRMADLVGILTMKGIVLGERYREKDAYDLYMLVKHARSSPEEVAAAIRPHLGDPLVREAMANLQTAFERREANGPAWVAAFLVNPVFSEEHERCITDAFMVVNAFTTRLMAPSPA